MVSGVPVRVLLADDHTMLREGLRRSLSALGLDIVGEAADGQRAMEMARDLNPDVVLMDVTMPVLDGIQATRRITRDYPRVRVVMLSMHVDEDLHAQAQRAGASAFLVKDCATSDIVAAINTAVGRVSDQSTNDLLSQREAEVLQHIANGMDLKATAEAMFVSVKTVKNHLTSAYAKLEVGDRTQAVLKAARLGIISFDA